MPSELQSAACRISATVMPADTAAVALVECPLYIETFTPDFCRATLSHRATEDGAIGLCGFITANSSFCSPLDILTTLVAFSYDCYRTYDGFLVKFREEELCSYFSWDVLLRKTTWLGYVLVARLRGT